ncbi:MAG: PD-(D/E)XK nuclease family protein [Verrucomicrobia bacterium]|nr:PD-(D/E)XK nuclease family protein [Verrucomicrobiota bacterium]
MAELKNTFSWSFSAAGDFDECRRRRYWSKYAMWNGWNRDASPIQKAAYRLNKMDSVATLRGQVAEDCIMWMLREKQRGCDLSTEEVYEKKARAMLRKAWDESRAGDWKTRPKQNCCLHEHYYPQFARKTDKELMVDIAESVKLCIANFKQHVLPRLEHIKATDEIEVATVAAGDPESFELEGIKVYAIPDYVYRRGDECHIHDWKAGRPRESHVAQLAVYGLWALIKHGIPVENLQIHLEYLMLGETHSMTLSENDLEEVKERISESVGDMRSYLVGGDLAKNQAMPMEVWDLAATSSVCTRCNFYELCEEELKEAMIE